MLLHIDRLVEIIVDKVILGRLFTNVVLRWRHTDEMNLMECGTFRANPRVLCAFVTVMEDLTADCVVGVVSRRFAVT